MKRRFHGNDQVSEDAVGPTGDLLESGNDRPFTCSDLVSPLDFRYPVQEGKLGYFLIFNQENFDTLPTRNGTNEDAQNLQRVAEALGFEVVTFKNSQKEKIFAKAKDYAAMDHSQYSCFACAILTHGDTDEIGHRLAATDGSFYLHDVLALFSDQKCKTLSNKPKLFFVQACRGAGKDKFETDTLTPFAPNFSGVTAKSLYGEAHFLIAQSTLPGCESSREEVHGTPFVNALCNSFDQHLNCSTEFTINQVLCDANKLVAEYGWLETNDDQTTYVSKQMPSVTSLLTRDLFFENHLEHVEPLQAAAVEATIESESSRKACLIVVYEGYEKYFGPPDTANLLQATRQTGYLAITVQYKTKRDFQNIIDDLRDNSECKIFFCALLTFTDKTTLKCKADDGDFTIEDFLAPFTWDQSPNLKHTPKLFFIQAPTVSAKDNGKGLFGVQHPYFRPYPTIPPLYADMLIAHSLSSKTLKDVDGNHLSLFVSCLCENILEFHDRLNVVQILQRVNWKMSLEGLDEVARVTNQLRELVMLNKRRRTD